MNLGSVNCGSLLKVKVESLAGVDMLIGKLLLSVLKQKSQGILAFHYFSFWHAVVEAT